MRILSCHVHLYMKVLCSKLRATKQHSGVVVPVLKGHTIDVVAAQPSQLKGVNFHSAELLLMDAQNVRVIVLSK